jgi:hypothetical protein
MDGKLKKTIETEARAENCCFLDTGPAKDYTKVWIFWRTMQAKFPFCKEGFLFATFD